MLTPAEVDAIDRAYREYYDTDGRLVVSLCATIRSPREQLVETQTDRERLLQDNERYEKTILRLTSRGIEDMQHRIAELEEENGHLRKAGCVADGERVIRGNLDGSMIIDTRDGQVKRIWPNCGH